MSLRFSFLFLLFSVTSLLAQEGQPIELINPSFEDMPRHSKPPRGWFDCGAPFESPPDVQPSGMFQVQKSATNGETYLGMVVRDNDTWEAVAQRLSSPIEKGKCYEFSIALSLSELYVSVSRVSDKEVNYTTPAKLRIWGGNGYCNKLELLAESSQIINTRWLEYNFRFEPTQNHSYIMLEAFYKTPTLFPYNGNVLVDNASAIVPVPCDEPKQLAMEEPEPPKEKVNVSPSKPVVKPKATPPPPKPKEEPIVQAPTPKATPAPPIVKEEETTLGGIKRENLKAGQTVQLDRLFFEADKSIITNTSYKTLDEVFKFLNKNKDVIVEIGGHTNNTPPPWYCDSLSQERAKSVAQYLIQKGIQEQRLEYKGYGSRKPVASNRTPAGRKRNQRVEIKVLRFSEG